VGGGGLLFVTVCTRKANKYREDVIEAASKVTRMRD